MPPNSKKQQKSSLTMGYGLMAVVILLISAESAVKGDSSIPHPCDNVKCPDFSEMTCPADSSVRELLAEPLIAIDEEYEKYLNATTPSPITDEIFSQCCLNKKCICKLCHIPDCQNDEEVVVELEPESIDLPGSCCGKYECQVEPNCTKVIDTDSYWLTDCQRCKCYGGQRLCHQSCDEGIKKPAMCHSKNLNTFYEHGQRWKDGCYECECMNGEANCMITFCRGLNCPKHRQVMLKDQCCPVCWPTGFAMPSNDEEYDEESDNEAGGNHYDDENVNIDNMPQANDDYSDNEEEVEVDLELKPIEEMEQSTTTTVRAIISSTTTTTAKPSTIIKLAELTTSKAETIKTTPTPTPTTNKPCVNENLSSSTTTTTSTTAEPCYHQEVPPATYKVYRQVVELMPYSQHNDLLYIIIGCLSVIVVILAAWNIHLKAKQRSYRPVSNIDDNYNRMTLNIKKTNDYV